MSTKDRSESPTLNTKTPDSPKKVKYEYLIYAKWDDAFFPVIDLWYSCDSKRLLAFGLTQLYPRKRIKPKGLQSLEEYVNDVNGSSESERFYCGVLEEVPGDTNDAVVQFHRDSGEITVDFIQWFEGGTAAKAAAVNSLKRTLSASKISDLNELQTIACEHFKTTSVYSWPIIAQNCAEIL